MTELFCRRICLLPTALFTLAFASARAGENPFFRSELIFPLEHWHNHASSIVELANGDLLVCWYHGSGERQADDVVIMGARKRKGARRWSQPFLMEDIPGYPDTNPTMFVDPEDRLWLIWPTIIANEWHTALLKYRVSTDYLGKDPPKWSISRVLHVTPGDKFARSVMRALDELSKQEFPGIDPARVDEYLETTRRNAADKFSRRLGWMTRAHPFVLDGKRLIVPLYSDGFDFSLMAITDDWGQTWFASTPLVGLGNVQPSLAERKDGTLVAYMRDNGPPPKRLLVSQSRDRGATWGPVSDSELPNPGSGTEVLRLANGKWVLVYNDLEEGRHSLAIALSENEGRTWKWKRHIERDSDEANSGDAGRYHYPSIIQSRDGTLHVSFSYFAMQSEVKLDQEGRPMRKAIKHAHFNEAWILASP